VSPNAARSDRADTVQGSKGFLDGKNKTIVRMVQASGTPVHTLAIPDIGKVRLRYPIIPMHQEGSAIWKEFDALKDMALNEAKFARLYPTMRIGENNTLEEVGSSFNTLI